MIEAKRHLIPVVKGENVTSVHSPHQVSQSLDHKQAEFNLNAREITSFSNYFISFPFPIKINTK